MSGGPHPPGARRATDRARQDSKTVSFHACSPCFPRFIRFRFKFKSWAEWRIASVFPPISTTLTRPTLDLQHAG